jgi:hypothetical protein
MSHTEQVVMYRLIVSEKVNPVLRGMLFVAYWKKIQLTLCKLSLRVAPVSTRSNFECFMCHVKVSGPITALLKHVKVAHCICTSNAATFDFVCSPGGCKRWLSEGPGDIKPNDPRPCDTRPDDVIFRLGYLV